jgi:DNA relaxase NicK
MENEKHLDYIQCSANIDEQEFRANDYPLSHPMNFYKRGYIDGFGTRYYFGNPNSKKCLVVSAGKALQSLRNDGKQDNDIIASLIDLNGKFTRLDLAVTQIADGDMVTLKDLQRWFKKKKIKSPLAERGAKLISTLELDGNLYPETFYIGDLETRGDKGLFRAYDKGLQLGAMRDLMIRLELEERGDNAHNSAKRIAQGASIGSIFKTRFDIDNKKFQQCLDSPSVDISRNEAIPKDESISDNERRWKWLIEQVAPSLKKAIEQENVEAGKSWNLAQFIIASGLKPEMMKAVELLVEWQTLSYNERAAKYYKPD